MSREDRKLTTADFRIGNIVSGKNGRMVRISRITETEIEGIYAKGTDKEYISTWTDLGWLQSVRLKPWIITELGFVLSGRDGAHFSEYNFDSHLDFGIDFIDGSIYFRVSNWRFRITYLHQLQNAYYSLIGEEMEINSEYILRELA